MIERLSILKCVGRMTGRAGRLGEFFMKLVGVRIAMTVDTELLIDCGEFKNLFAIHIVAARTLQFFMTPRQSKPSRIMIEVLFSFRWI